jgi:16S rRNA G966 N2-methylase RsmD
MAKSWLTVSPIPKWIKVDDLLGPANWLPVDPVHRAGSVGLADSDTSNQHEHSNGVQYEAQLEQGRCVAIMARLRGVYIDGQKIECVARPSLKRNLMRQALLEESRLRRNISKGFYHSAVRLDEQGKFSLTPENLALMIGKQAQKKSITDLCCGSGGNAIGFARAGCLVTAIEIDLPRLRDAQHNASLYECQIQFIHGDGLIETVKQKADILWVDPPWGDFNKEDCGLKDFPLLLDLQNKLAANYSAVWLKLPASFNTADLSQMAAEAIFGCEEGDRHRVKFLLLKGTVEQFKQIKLS